MYTQAIYFYVYTQAVCQLFRDLGLFRVYSEAELPVRRDRFRELPP